MNESIIVGEAVAGESQKVRHTLETLVHSLNKSTFDVAELLHAVKKNKYYTSYGYNTFVEYTKTLTLKPRKAQYLAKIAEVMDEAGIKRSHYEHVGVAKLREITSISPAGSYKGVNGETVNNIDTIEMLVGAGEHLTLEEVKDFIKIAKGLFNEDELVWANFCIKRSVKEQTLSPAIEKAKAEIGTVKRDEDGNAIDPSDGAALEAICADYLGG